MVFRKGQKVQAVNELGRWEKARIVNVSSDGQYLVKFVGWSADFNLLVAEPEVREIVDPFSEFGKYSSYISYSSSIFPK